MGNPQDKAINRILACIFVAIAFVICLVPFAGLLWYQSPTEAGNEDNSRPSLVLEDGALNQNYLANIGDYFEANSAYKHEGIAIHARLYTSLLGVSPTDKVILGKDGWLFYGATLDDFLGLNVLSDRKISNIAHNLSLMQGYVESRGVAFAFTIAPNKNSLYPEKMPDAYTWAGRSNMDKLKQALEQSQINYVDMFSLFDAQEKELYYRSDSHWTPEGAFLATNELLTSIQRERVSVEDTYPLEHIGDIEAMLYPLSGVPETVEQMITGDWSFDKTSDTVETNFSKTTAQGEGTLVMYRDSFGDMVIPLIAPAFEQSYFSKMVPYNVTNVDTYRPDCVIVERVERHVGSLAEKAFIMPAPKAQITPTSSCPSNSVVECNIDGDFVVFKGYVDEVFIDEDDDILLQIITGKNDPMSYVPFFLSEGSSAIDEEGEETLSRLEGFSGDYGFCAAIPKESMAADSGTVEILVVKKSSSEVVSVCSSLLEW